MNRRLFRWHAVLLVGLAGPALGAPPPVSAASGEVLYVIRPGDTLIGLAKHYLQGAVAVQQVAALNHVVHPRRIPIGTPLRVPRALLRYDPITLRLAMFNGPVTLTLAGQSAPARDGAVLNEGDVVGTGANGFVLLAGSDGSRIALPSNSMVRIGRARHYLLIDTSDLDLALGRGRAEVQAAKQHDQGGFRIQTPIAVAAVRGTQFRVAYQEADGLGSAGVIEGAVGVATERKALTLPAGTGAEANAAGDLTAAPLLPAVAVLNPGKVLTEAVAELALAPVPGAARYRVQLARDAGFVDILQEVESTAPKAAFPDLANGRYFARATALTSGGLEGLAESYAIRRQRVGLKADVGQSPYPNAVRFNWLAEGEGQSRYRFQMFADGNAATALVDEAGLTTPGMTLTALPHGTYHWRVGVAQTTADGTVEVWTALQKLIFGR